MATSFDQIFSGTRPQQLPTYSSLYPTPSTVRACPPDYRRSSVKSHPGNRQTAYPNEKAVPRQTQRPLSHELQPSALPPRTSRNQRPRAASSAEHSRHNLSVPKAKATRKRSPQPSVAWDGDDSSRLPEGFKRTGYNADEEVYYFRDREGRQWQSKPGNEYGVLVPVPKETQGKRGMFDSSSGIKRSRTVSNPNPRHTFEKILDGGEKKGVWGRLRGLSIRD